MVRREIIVGSRGSKLALAQTEEVIGKLAAAWPGLTFRSEVIKTQGDKLLASPLTLIGGKGVFVKELETALRRKRIDLAVHSLKDLPTEFPKGLEIGAVTKREDPRDVLLVPLHRRWRGGIVKGQRVRVGTSSLRRKSQLLAKWPHLQIVALRGNLDTRLGKLKEGKLDAIVVAAAGLRRLKIENRKSKIENRTLTWMLPAPGQGAVAIEVRAGDRSVAKLVAVLNHPATERATTAERSLLTALGGGCLVPIGALASERGQTLVLNGIVASEDGRRSVKSKLSGDRRYPERLGRKLAAVLIEMGAKEILNAR